MKSLTASFLHISAASFSCSDRKPSVAAPSAVPADDAFRKIAQAAMTDAAAALTGALTKAMGEAGVPAALRFCSENAHEVTESATQRHPGLLVQRVAAKNRNPANATGISDLVVMNAFSDSLAKGRPAQPVVLKEAEQLVFYAPILLEKPLYLHCHGTPMEDINPANAAIIQELYPKDNATGFKLGDLRGMWRISAPLPQ